MKLWKTLPAGLAIIFLGFLSLDASERPVRVHTESGSVSVRFNGECIKSFYKIFDARSTEEKTRTAKEGKLDGSVTVFFHGHARRPDDADEFMSHFARRSRSGIIVIPVCDTPFGRDSKWRGDDGKDVVLMEVTRHVLEHRGFSIHSYAPITEKSVSIKERETPSRPYHDPVSVSILAVGYSHGAILARRFASRYPSTVTGLAHITPAGYVNWGNGSCLSSGCLTTGFSLESMRIGMGIFTGDAGHVGRAAWGVIRGFSGDCIRSYGSCLYGNPNPLKTGRSYCDIRDCAQYIDDSNAPVTHIAAITVIFGQKDTLFNFRRMGIITPGEITQKDEKKFWNTYYPSSAENGTKLTLKLLPGNHIGLQTHYREYVRTILESTGQLLENTPGISSR